MITFKLLYINVDTIKKILLLDCQDKIFISFCEGDQGNKWNADTAYIKTYTTFQVVIEATIFNRGAYNFKNEVTWLWTISLSPKNAKWISVQL